MFANFVNLLRKQNKNWKSTWLFSEFHKQPITSSRIIHNLHDPPDPPSICGVYITSMLQVLCNSCLWNACRQHMLCGHMVAFAFFRQSFAKGTPLLSPSKCECSGKRVHRPALVEVLLPFTYSFTYTCFKVRRNPSIWHAICFTSLRPSFHRETPCLCFGEREHMG